MMFDIFMICVLCGLLVFAVYIAHNLGYKSGFNDGLCYKHDEYEQIVFKSRVKKIKNERSKK